MTRSPDRRILLNKAPWLLTPTSTFSRPDAAQLDMLDMLDLLDVLDMLDVLDLALAEAFAAKVPRNAISVYQASGQIGPWN